MRLKLFLAALMACGFIAFVIANETIGSTEIDNDEMLPNSAELVETVPEKVKTVAKAIVKNVVNAAQVMEATTMGAQNASVQRSGALINFDDYLGELGYDVYGDSGYNWGKFKFEYICRILRNISNYERLPKLSNFS